jgi:ABC-type transport system involved in multi-copper enzyme maturation permease subunit
VPSGEPGKEAEETTVSSGPTDWLLAGAVVTILLSIPALAGGLGPLISNLWILFVAIVAAAFGALTFTREREQHTLQPLLMTMLSPRDVVAGKAGAACALAGFYALPFLPLVCLSFLTRPLVLVATLFYAAAGGWLAAAIGLSMSWICRQTSVAVAGSLACVFAIVPLIAQLPYFVSPSFPLGRWLHRWPDFPVLAAWFDTSNDSGHLRSALALSLVFYVAGAFLLALLHHRLHPAVLERDGTSIWSRDLTKDA